MRHRPFSRLPTELQSLSDCLRVVPDKDTDDITFVGTAGDVCAASMASKALLASIGLTLNASKCFVYSLLRIFDCVAAMIPESAARAARWDRPDHVAVVVGGSKTGSQNQSYCM
jgi:hypothetical protein